MILFSIYFLAILLILSNIFLSNIRHSWVLIWIPTNSGPWSVTARITGFKCVSFWEIKCFYFLIALISFTTLTSWWWNNYLWDFLDTLSGWPITKDLNLFYERHSYLRYERPNHPTFEKGFYKNIKHKWFGTITLASMTFRWWTWP